MKLSEGQPLGAEVDPLQFVSYEGIRRAFSELSGWDFGAKVALVTVVEQCGGFGDKYPTARSRRGCHRCLPCAGSLISAPKLFHRRRGDAPASPRSRR